MSNFSEQMQADALEAQRFSRKHLVLELDFSEISIRELEANIDSVEYAIAGGRSSENIDRLTRMWGAYLGEALLRCGAEWVEDDHGRTALRVATTVVYPHDQVRRRLIEGDEHNLVEYFHQVRSQLSGRR